MMAVQKLYYWQALRSDGEFCAGERIGTSRNEIYQYLLELGYQPLRLKTGQYLTPLDWRGPQLSVIIRQLATLLQAGLPLLDALDLLGRQHEKAGWRCLLQEIRQQVAQGRALSEVLADYPAAFPMMCSSLVAVGELTGKLDDCCARLANYQENQRQLTGKVIKALRYPAFVIAVGLLVALLMLTLVLPEFAGLYASFDAPLPWLTRMMLRLSDALSRHAARRPSRGDIAGLPANTPAKSGMAKTGATATAEATAAIYSGTRPLPEPNLSYSGDDAAGGIDASFRSERRRNAE